MAGRVAILGTGQMAVMCARLLCDNGHDVTMIGRQPTVGQMRQSRQSPHLPGEVLPDRCDVSDVPPTDAAMTVLAIPTQAMRHVIAGLNAWPGGTAVSCAKGIELETGLRPSEIAQKAGVSGPIAVLSGPNIAHEVVDRLAACSAEVRGYFATEYFRVYTSDDVVGVELAAASKNVIAVAAGIVDGLALGNNAKAALITRGIVEISRLGNAMGARPETFAGLAGMGDLMTTCFSPRGRNRRLGELIGQGRTLEQARGDLGSTAEGVPTTRALLQLAEKHHVEMPICSAVAGVLFDGVDPRRTLGELMTRQAKAEV